MGRLSPMSEHDARELLCQLLKSPDGKVPAYLVRQLLAWLRAVALGKHGGKRDQASNISLKTHGTSASYAVARLRRDRPERP